MLATAPIVVHVVTSGTDWLALAAVISTGVVGLAGIGATLWQASRTSAREDQRQHLAQRRRIYASCLTALNECMSAAMRRDAYESETEAEKYGFALLAAMNAVAEILLIAGSDVSAEAGSVLRSLGHFTPHDYDAVAVSIGVLTALMRSDLGEPAIEPEAAQISR